MKKHFLFLSIILIIIAFISCTKYKSGSYSAKGTVRYDSTGSPAQGVSVILLLETREAKGQSSSTVTRVTSTYTDSKGEYIIYYKKLRGWQYSYSVGSVQMATTPYGYIAQNPLNDQKSTVNLLLK